eukprot:12725595-Ditylum_brightwellii.AAC.1
MDVTSNKGEEKEKEMVQEQMQQAGEQDIVETLCKETTVRLDFNLGSMQNKFMARASMFQVMIRITSVNNTAHAKSINSNKVWNDFSSFPMVEQFNEEFKIRQETKSE